MNKIEQLKPSVSFYIHTASANEPVVFNEEIAALCRQVRDHKSIYAAAAEVGISYGKAWRVIKEAESELGFMLFEREGCKGSNLSPEGRRLLDIYESIHEHLDKQAQQLYACACDCRK